MSKNKLLPLLILASFLILRVIKFSIFLATINIQVDFIKLLTLTITGFIIYFFSLRNKVLAIITYIFESFWISLNSIYFLYFDNYFHILNFFFHLSTNFSSAKESISFLSAINVISWANRLAVITIDLVPFILILLKSNYPSIKEILKTKISNYLFLSFISILLTLELINTFKGKGLIQYISKSLNGDITIKEEKQIIHQYGTIFINSLDIAYLINKNIIYKKLSKYKSIQFKENNNKKNFIIIQVESLDSSIIFTNYKNVPITPFLRKLSSNSIFFPYTVSYHFAGYTSDAEFTVINSIHPLKDIPSIRYWEKFDNSIAKIFKKNNYNVWAFHNNHGRFFGREEAYKKMGFDEFFDVNKMNLIEKRWGAEDKDMLNFVYNFVITNNNKNFFSYIITMSSHGPFNLVQNYYTNELFNDIEDEITKNYFNSMNYVDKVLSNFITKTSKLSDTIIVIFGDHHSSVGDSKYYKRSVSYLNGKVIEIVPLFILYNNHKKIITEPVSQLDIGPTILSISGLKAKIKTMGEVILPYPKEDKIFYLGEFIKKDEIKNNLNFDNIN
ncbi:MAG: LTA synthase family protein [Brevinematia bacterium]